MKRAELEHILRAAAGLTNERELVVVGAAALQGAVLAPAPDLAQTFEADMAAAGRNRKRLENLYAADL